MNTRIKKTYSGILTAIIIAVQIIAPFSASLLAPKQAEAQFTDGANLVQNTITAVKSVFIAGAMHSLQVKELALDAVAYAIAKQILRGITTSVVEWINNGFNGNPSFLTNPGQFFTDIADEILGGMILGSDLAFLCSNFSIDIRLELAFKYRPFQRDRAACTLSDVIGNVTVAGQGASINGFTAGDFRQGGMPAFVSMTTEPQNNFIGAYVIASDEASARIANAQIEQQNQLTQGRGFLSFKTCKDERIINEVEANRLTARNNELAADGRTDSDEFIQNTGQLQGYYESASNETTRKVCEVQTPGSVIAGTLETSLGSPVRELELADEFNEIINALFAQLIQRVLVGGLRGVSGQSAGDSQSVIQQLQAEQALNTEQVQNMKESILGTVDTFIAEGIKYRDTKNQTLKIFEDLQTKFTEVKTCYAQALQRPSRYLTSSAIAHGLRKIDDIDVIINRELVPKINILSLDAQNMNASITSLNRIKNQASTLTDAQALGGVATEYNNLVPGLNLYTTRIVDAETELSDTRESTRNLEDTANREMNNCRQFPNILR